MEEFEVNVDDRASHRDPGADVEDAWWEKPSGSAQADKNVRMRRCRRRRRLCIVFILLAVCGIIAAIVLPTVFVKRSSGVVAAATGGTNANGEDSNERTCNGLASNCYRRVNEIMYPTVHNAMAALENQFVVAYNNLYSLEKALESGFRGFLLDSCVCTGLGTQMCHSTCAIGYRRPGSVFEGIRDFLQNNENEIVILELQIGANTFEDLYEKMLQVENLTSLMYNHPYRTAPWPIINDLIANNTRLIIFQHDGPDCNAGLCPPGFHNTYEFVFETTWNATGLEGLMNFNETCVRTRGRKGSAFVLSNHFATNSLGLPEQEIAEEVNLADNIRNRTDTCTEMLGRQTNLLAVDFWSIGDTLQVVQKYNMALPDITEAPSMSPVPSASPTDKPSLSPSPSAQPSLTPTVAATETTVEPPPPTVGAAPSSQAVDPQFESLAPSGGVVETFMPTTASAQAPVGAPAVQVSETFAPVLDDPFTQAPISTPVFDVTPFPTVSEPAPAGTEDSPSVMRSEEEGSSHVPKHFFHNGAL